MDEKLKQKAVKALQGIVRTEIGAALKDLKKPVRPKALATAIVEGTDGDEEHAHGTEDGETRDGDEGEGEGSEGAEGSRGRTTEGGRVFVQSVARDRLDRELFKLTGRHLSGGYTYQRKSAVLFGNRLGRGTAPKSVSERYFDGDVKPAARTMAWLRALFAGDAQGLRKFGGRSRADLVDAQGRALGEASLGPGGGLVPEEFAQDVIGKMGDMTPLANRDFLRVVPMNSDRIIVPALSTLPVAVYGSENTAPAGQTEPAWKQIELVAREAVLLVPVSMYLIDDATVDLIQYLTDLFADALARLRNLKLLKGSGSQEPEGILSAQGVTAVTYVTTNGGTKFDSVVNTYHTIRPRYRDGAVWVMSDVALQILSEIKDSNNQPLLNQLADEPFPRLRGKPVFVTEAIESSSPARAVFGNWQYYLFGDRMAMVADTDRSGIYFQSRQVAIRIIERYDGRVAQTEAFAVLTAIA